MCLLMSHAILEVYKAAFNIVLLNIILLLSQTISLLL